jgi:hypothetical protein
VCTVWLCVYCLVLYVMVFELKQVFCRMVELCVLFIEVQSMIS